MRKELTIFKSLYFQVFLLITILLTFVLWFIGDVIAPFLFGAVIAYLLDPIADKLEEKGLGRVLGVILITSVTLLFLIGISILLLPLLIQQANLLILNFPDFLSFLINIIEKKFPNVLDMNFIKNNLSSSLKELISNQKIQENSIDVAAGVLSLSTNFLKSLFFLVVTPVITFYLLLDWNRLCDIVKELIPKKNYKNIIQIFTEIDNVLAAFIRGQMTVCAVLGAFYAIFLMIIGLQFGLVIGILAGLVSFIPFVGALLGSLIAVILAIYQFWDNPINIFLVILVFVVGQILEGNFLTPKLVGNAVRLHPVWLMLSLSIFGALAGFTGLIIAVPLAAIIGVLCRFFTKKYLESNFYDNREL